MNVRPDLLTKLGISVVGRYVPWTDEALDFGLRPRPLPTGKPVNICVKIMEADLSMNGDCPAPIESDYPKFPKMIYIVRLFKL